MSFYNVGSGFPTHNPREEAELAAGDLVDVGSIREDSND